MLNAEKLMRLAEDQNFSEIIKLCREEIISAEAKKSDGASFEKSRKAFAKYLKAQKNAPQVNFHYYSMQNILDYGECQCITNGYSAICVFGEKFSGEFIEKLPKDLSPFDLSQVFPKDFKYYPICIEISQSDINAAYKIAGLTDKDYRVVKLAENWFFNLNVIKPVTDVLGDCKVYIGEKLFSPVIVESKIGVGVILPLKVKADKVSSIKSLSEILEK